MAKRVLIKLKANWKALIIALISLIVLLFAADTDGKILQCIKGCFN